MEEEIRNHMELKSWLVPSLINIKEEVHKKTEWDISILDILVCIHVAWDLTLLIKLLNCFR